MPPPIPRWNPGACRVARGYPLLSPGRRPSPYSNRVGFHIGLFRGLHGVHFRCGLPARRTAKAARCLEGFDGFVTSAAAPIATGWSDQLSGRESHPLKIRAFSRRTAIGTPVSAVTTTIACFCVASRCQPVPTSFDPLVDRNGICSANRYGRSGAVRRGAASGAVHPNYCSPLTESALRPRSRRQTIRLARDRAPVAGEKLLRGVNDRDRNSFGGEMMECACRPARGMLLPRLRSAEDLQLERLPLVAQSESLPLLQVISSLRNHGHLGQILPWTSDVFSITGFRRFRVGGRPSSRDPGLTHSFPPPYLTGQVGDERGEVENRRIETNRGHRGLFTTFRNRKMGTSASALAGL